MAPGDETGHSVAPAGYVNSDGDSHGRFSGASYVVFGRKPDATVTRIERLSREDLSYTSIIDSYISEKLRLIDLT